MKLQRLERILQLTEMLKSERSFSIDELSEALGITRRTLFRDIESMRQAGIPCQYDAKEKRYHIEGYAFLPALALTVHEAISLLIAAEQTGTIRGMPLLGAARVASAKIQNALPSHTKKRCGSILDQMSIHLAAQARHKGCEPTFGSLQKAVAGHHQVRIRYESLYDKGTIELVLDPYHLHYSQRAWYVIGHSSLHEETRIFKIARIASIEVLKRLYVIDAPFNILDFLGNAWSLMRGDQPYHVVLRFAARVASNVAEVHWHRTEKLSWQNDGTLQFEVDVDGLHEIVWWIMGYGDTVRVLEPEALITLVRQKAQALLEQYAPDTTP
jgi:predicted DNA-binding transcriptional regulator YafY